MTALPPEVTGPAARDEPAPAGGGRSHTCGQWPSSGTFRLPARGLVFEELERDFVRQALERTGGNQTRAARLLGMTRDQIRYRIRKFALAVRPDTSSAA
jgi:DNA-binding NtrC family response regulator